jgi:hypothetical protein
MYIQFVSRGSHVYVPLASMLFGLQKKRSHLLTFHCSTAMSLRVPVYMFPKINSVCHRESAALLECAGFPLGLCHCHCLHACLRVRYIIITPALPWHHSGVAAPRRAPLCVAACRG